MNFSSELILIFEIIKVGDWPIFVMLERMKLSLTSSENTRDNFSPCWRKEAETTEHKLHSSQNWHCLPGLQFLSSVCRIFHRRGRCCHFCSGYGWYKHKFDKKQSRYLSSLFNNFITLHTQL